MPCIIAKYDVFEEITTFRHVHMERIRWIHDPTKATHYSREDADIIIETYTNSPAMLEGNGKYIIMSVIGSGTQRISNTHG